MMFGPGLWKKYNKLAGNSKLPQHIAIIPDGNGRWARRRGLPRKLGHREGAEVLNKVIRYLSSIGIKYVTVYAFSTENWKRPKDEVDALMALLSEFLTDAGQKLEGTDVRIKIFGDVEGLPAEIKGKVPEVSAMTEKNSGMQLNIALNYGGRSEILNAVKGIAKGSVSGEFKLDEIDENLMSGMMYTAGIPDPDLLIRTGGECRSSNFLLWQMAYTEYWFTAKLWPDMGVSDIAGALKDFVKRNRRFGGI